MINDLPPAPSRGDDPDVFVGRADAWMAALPAFGAEANLLAERLNATVGVGNLGYLPPVPYAAGISMTLGVQSVQFAGSTYAPLLGALPFTTSGIFETAKFRVIQGVTAAELAAPNGVEAIGNALDQRELAEPDTAARLGLADVPVAAYQRRLRARASFGEAQRGMLAQTPVSRPNRTFMDALMSGHVRIVVPSDSISEGADTWYVNAWVRNFTEMLRAQIPWIQWEVINLSLGGRGLRDLQDAAYTSPDDFYRAPKIGGLDSEVWSNGSTVAGKAWRDYVRDAEPDLIIMAHQENMGEDVAFMETCWNNFKAYTETWPKKPWFCLAPTHLPTKRTDVYDGVFAAQQVGRQALADWLRTTALQNGYGLIDVNSVFRMLRDGQRTEVVPYRVERDFRYWGQAGEWALVAGAPPTLSGGSMTLAAGALIMRTGATARDVDICGDVNPTSGSVLRITYRSYKGAAYSVQYDLTSGVVTLYYGNTSIGGAAISGPAGAGNIRVKACGPRHEVYYNGKLLFRATHSTGSYHGNVVVGFVQDLGAGGSISNFWLCLGVEDDVAPEYFDEAELFGVYPPNLTTDIDSVGGDGIHHLSNQGVFLVYLTAAQAFIEQIKGILARQHAVSTGILAETVSGPTNGTVAAMAGTVCTVTVSRPQTLLAHVTLGYQNPGPSPGVLQLRLNGAGWASWWLPSTAIDGQPHTLSMSVPVDVSAGTHTLDLAWGASPTTQAAMTSGGGGGGRSLVVMVTPA